MKKSVVWIWRRWSGFYAIGGRKPSWKKDSDGDFSWDGNQEEMFCDKLFESLFPFFTMPPDSLGKITNTANTLTFEIMETKK